jgi:biotin-(acetyl-CoA carboxylase) ligase
MSTGGFPTAEVETVERFGRLVRHFPVAVSAEVMALSWANREDGPQGATVVVDHEIRPSGLHGRIWYTPPADTLACSVVLRPALSVEAANAAWLVAALAAANGAAAATGRDLATWWPDSVIDTETREAVSAVRAEIQLGPGRVKSAVVTLRFDLPKLGLDAGRRDELLEAVTAAVDEACQGFEDDAAGAAAAYEKRCALIGNRVKIRLLPKGETRGTARRVDRAARLELESPSGMVERITVDQVGALDVV